MDSLFRELKIYAVAGPEVRAGRPRPAALATPRRPTARSSRRASPRPARLASFIAAGTAYATRGVPMVPFYTFYSMFGFQRVGDLIWQAADARTRGFLLGATAGRTTLLGEGLQHQDGHWLVLASTVPAVPGLRPGVRLRGGGDRPGRPAAHVRRRQRPDRDVFYYLTLYNENYPMPAMPEGDRPVRDDIVRGLYRWATGTRGPSTTATIAVLRVGAGRCRARRPTSWPSTSTSASSCGRPRRTSGSARRRSRSSAGTACTQPSRRARRCRRSCSPMLRARSSPSPTS